jgi:hypothetical protein
MSHPKIERNVYCVSSSSGSIIENRCTKPQTEDELHCGAHQSNIHFRTSSCPGIMLWLLDANCRQLTMQPVAKGHQHTSCIHSKLYNHKDRLAKDRRTSSSPGIMRWLRMMGFSLRLMRIADSQQRTRVQKCFTN